MSPVITPIAGWLGVALGLAGSLLLVLYGFRGQRRPGAVRRSQLKFAVECMVGGAVLAMVALQVALLTDNFAVSYVAETHSRATPLMFTITGAWAALDGSIVLWTLVLAGYTAWTLRGVRDTDDRLGVGALAILGLVGVFFFGLVSTVANPFEILSNPPADGPGPNPILADNILMAFHPPMLYLGYVGFTVPFAFAMSALILRQGGVHWLQRTRRANLVAWSFLTGGLVLGAWWSYEVLGWGGYWAWDPVENAALIPWLVATAFIHSSVVQVKRGMLQAWNFALVIATYALTILGTFLTRSAVVVSVHSFTQSGVGPALLGFLVVVLAGGFTLFALRGEHVASASRPESLVSREGAFLVNNLLLTVFAFIVLMGTVYPILVEAFTGTQVSVGRPFFDRMAVPLAFALLLAMGVGPFLPYRYASPMLMWKRLRLPLLGGAAAAAATVLSGITSVGVIAVVAIATAIAVASAAHLIETAPRPRWRGIPRVLLGQRAYWGGQLAHLGLAFVAVVIAVSGAMVTRSTVTVQIGQSVEFSGYTVTFDRVEEHPRPDRMTRDAHIVFAQDGETVWTATPRLNAFRNQTQAVGQPSVWTRPGSDIYVALAQFGEQQVSLNLYRYPMMVWLWFGGALIAAGGLWALSGRTRQLDPSKNAERATTDA